MFPPPSSLVSCLPLPPPPSKGYALRSKDKPKEVSPSKGGLALDVPQMSTTGRKSHISKAKELTATKIRKGMQATITRALRAGKSLPPLKK
jgi:hypothetical protein